MCGKPLLRRIETGAIALIVAMLIAATPALAQKRGGTLTLPKSGSSLAAFTLSTAHKRILTGSA